MLMHRSSGDDVPTLLTRMSNTRRVPLRCRPGKFTSNVVFFPGGKVARKTNSLNIILENPLVATKPIIQKTAMTMKR